MVRNNVGVSPLQPDDARVTAFFLGVATVVAQALLLREAMAAMGGSELAWGVVMGLWLIGMAAGSRFGASFGPEKIAAWLPAAVLVFAGIGVVTFRAAPAVIGATPGEAITTASAVWLWALAIAPAALVGGLGFPLVAHAFGPGGGGRAYAFEAIGALAGGTLLSVGLIYLGAASALCLTLGAVAIGLSWHRRSAVCAALALVFFAAALPAGGVLARAGWDWSGHPGDLRAWFETRHQHVAVSEGPPTSIYGDGRLLASYPDPYTTLPRAHLLMLLHPRPRRVFAVGCVADGSVEAMSRHRVDKLVAVEDDPDLLRALPALYGADMKAALDRPQILAVADDPLRVLQQANDWDLIILMDGDPVTLRNNRTRTLEFLRACRAHMHSEAVLVLRVGVSDTYIGGGGGRLLSVLVATVREVFEQLVILPGEETLLVAGGPHAEITLNHDILIRRLEASDLDASDLMAEMVPLLVDHDRSSDLISKLPLDSSPNTIQHPRAVLFAGGLHEGRALQGLLPLIGALEKTGRWPLGLALGAVVLALLGAAVLGRAPTGVTAAAIGFSSMGWWLLLIATWQSTRGSVYSEIGALTAAFMAGLAGGSLAAGRWRQPERRLPAVLVAGSVLSILLAVGLALAVPTVGIPLLLAAGGLITGAAFPGLSRLGARDTRSGAGVAFAADEAGAAAAAFVLGVFVISWVGFSATAWGIAVVQIATIPAVLIALRRN